MTRSTKRRQRKKKGAAEGLDVVVHDQKEKIEALIDAAEASLDNFNYEDAESKLNEILKIDSSNVKSLELLAGIYIEQFKWPEAENLLEKCVELSPNSGYSKYFSLGQLCEGEKSLKFYQRGIQIIEKELEDSENVLPTKEASKRALLKNLSDAFCSVAEIFMTDCCFAENAEEECFAAIQAAIKYDPSNSEAYQCLANFHLVKEQVAEAKEAVDKALSFWLPQHEALRDGDTTLAANSDSENLIPSYESRIKTSKLLIELEMYDEAVKILDGLIDEDDEVVEVWYLLGWTNYLQGDEYKQNAHYYFKKAKKVSIKVGMEDVDYVSHVNELLEELAASYPLDEEDEDVENECESDFSTDSETDNKMEL